MSFQISAVCFSQMGSGQTANEDNFYFAGKSLPEGHRGIDSLWETHFSTQKTESLCLFDGVSEQGAQAGPLTRAASEGFAEAQRAIVLNDDLDSGLFSKLLEVLNRLVNRRKEVEGLTDCAASALCMTMDRDQLYISWVGDSSVYCVRQGMCRRLNEPQPGFSRLPAQYLGLDAKLTLDPRVLHGALMDGDLFLLCSGNLSEALPPSEIAAVLKSKQSLIGKGRALLAMAEQKQVTGDRSLLLFRAERENAGSDLFADAITVNTPAPTAVKPSKPVEEPAAPTPVQEPAVSVTPAAPAPQPTLAQKDDTAPLTVEDFENEPLPEPAAPEREPAEESTDQFGEEVEEDDEDSVAISLDSILRRLRDSIPKKWRPLMLLVLLLVLALIVAGVFFGGGKVQELVDPRSAVPTVTGMTEVEASAALKEADLVLQTGDPVYSDTVEEGLAVSQSPVAGEKLDPGTTVTVVFSRGEEPVMPDLSGLTEDTALKALKPWNLKVEVLEETVYSEEVEEGKIAAQSVKAGTTIPEDAKLIQVKLSKGSEYAEVPALTGMSQSEAIEAAENLGFVVETTEAYSDTIASGEVMEQDLAANEKEKIGSTITLTVSKGPEKVAVPNVVGWWQSEAQPKLENLGFVVSIVSEYNEWNDRGIVLSQSVTDSAVPGTTITLCISLGSQYPKEEETTTPAKPKDPVRYVG